MADKPRDLHSNFDRDVAYGRSLVTTINAGLASVIVLPANRFRKQAVFVNNSDTVIYLAKGTTAILNAGIRLNAAGGTYIEESDALGYLWVGQFAAISSAATKNLSISEDS